MWETFRSILGEDFFLENTLILGGKSERQGRDQNTLFCTSIFENLFLGVPKFEHPPLLTRPFVPRTLSKLLEGTLPANKFNTQMRPAS